VHEDRTHRNIIRKMREARIGRVLVASLHQAIADLLPTRLEFYENWISSVGLREGTIGLAPLTAVLSFLRHEGEAYDLITSRAGRYAADWSVASVPAWRRTLVRAMPRPLRARFALRMARNLVRNTYGGTRAIVRVRRRNGLVDIRGSLFCEVREARAEPLCGYYAAAIARYLELFNLPTEARITRCRAVGARACAVEVSVR